jgi:hypothetical protein
MDVKTKMEMMDATVKNQITVFAICDQVLAHPVRILQCQD